jgi:branched-chain amino acid transport system ATP-binding protein
MDAILEIDSLSVRYGGVTALRDVSLKVPRGDLVALVGRNGAGKSTLVRAASGIVRCAGGRVHFDGERVDGKPAYRIARRGLAHVPEGRQVLGPMTVRENLELGRVAAARPHPPMREQLAQVYELFPRLREREGQMAGSQSGGEQQMLALGRALMARPKLMLLDEPSLGLAPVIVNLVFDALHELNAQGIGILLIEQDVKRALEVASYCYVLDRGRIVREGPAEVLRNDPAIQADYLGVAEDIDDHDALDSGRR